MLEMRHAHNIESLPSLWQGAYDRFYPDKKAKAVITPASFGGLERRREETHVSTLLFGNQALVKHLDATIAKAPRLASQPIPHV